MASRSSLSCPFGKRERWGSSARWAAATSLRARAALARSMRARSPARLPSTTELLGIGSDFGALAVSGNAGAGAALGWTLTITSFGDAERTAGGGVVVARWY